MTYEEINKIYPGMRQTSTRTIIKVSGDDYWYKDLIGKKVTIHKYGSFGCWDDKGRWYNFYDLSETE